MSGLARPRCVTSIFSLWKVVLIRELRGLDLAQKLHGNNACHPKYISPFRFSVRSCLVKIHFRSSKLSVQLATTYIVVLMILAFLRGRTATLCVIAAKNTSSVHYNIMIETIRTKLTTMLRTRKVAIAFIFVIGWHSKSASS